jgi:hypothetical protein
MLAVIRDFWIWAFNLEFLVALAPSFAVAIFDAIVSADDSDRFG